MGNSCSCPELEGQSPSASASRPSVQTGSPQTGPTSSASHPSQSANAAPTKVEETNPSPIPTASRQPSVDHEPEDANRELPKGSVEVRLVYNRPRVANHWGLRIGDTIYEIFHRKGRNKVHIRQWADASHRFTHDELLGTTYMTQDAVKSLGESLMTCFDVNEDLADKQNHAADDFVARHPIYHSVTGSCQIFVEEMVDRLDLVRACPENPRATSDIPELSMNIKEVLGYIGSHDQDVQTLKRQIDKLAAYVIGGIGGSVFTAGCVFFEQLKECFRKVFGYLGDKIKAFFRKLPAYLADAVKWLSSVPFSVLPDVMKTLRQVGAKVLEAGCNAARSGYEVIKEILPLVIVLAVLAAGCYGLYHVGRGAIQLAWAGGKKAGSLLLQFRRRENGDVDIELQPYQEDAVSTQPRPHARIIVL